MSRFVDVGKGDKRRPAKDPKKFAAEYDRLFANKVQPAAAGTHDNVIVEKVWVNDDPNNTPPKWKRATLKLSDGSLCTTFSVTDISIAGEAEESRSPVTIVTTPNTKDPEKYHPTIESITPSGQPANASEEPQQQGRDLREQMHTATIRSVNDLGPLPINGVQTECWTIETTDGSFGCTDADLAQAARANIETSVVLHSVANPPHKLRLAVRLDDIVF